MDLLSRMEEVYLLTIMVLKEDAYGVTIKRSVSEKTGKILSYGGLYFALDQLVRKGLVKKTPGEPTSKRGGRRKFYYTLTTNGKEALREVFEHQRSLWDSMSDIAFD